MATQVFEQKHHSINSRSEHDEIEIDFQHEGNITVNPTVNSKVAIAGVCVTCILEGLSRH